MCINRLPPSINTYPVGSQYLWGPMLNPTNLYTNPIRQTSPSLFAGEKLRLGQDKQLVQHGFTTKQHTQNLSRIPPASQTALHYSCFLGPSQGLRIFLVSKKFVSITYYLASIVLRVTFRLDVISPDLSMSRSDHIYEWFIFFRILHK